MSERGRELNARKDSSVEQENEIINLDILQFIRVNEKENVKRMKQKKA